eukprot:719228-Lingulodinium_polyedra.AAC.1
MPPPARLSEGALPNATGPPTGRRPLAPCRAPTGPGAVAALHAWVRARRVPAPHAGKAGLLEELRRIRQDLRGLHEGEAEHALVEADVLGLGLPPHLVGLLGCKDGGEGRAPRVLRVLCPMECPGSRRGTAQSKAALHQQRVPVDMPKELCREARHAIGLLPGAEDWRA